MPEGVSHSDGRGRTIVVFIVEPLRSGNYAFRFTNLQAVIVEWNGQSRVVNPNDYLDLGKFGQKRVRLTALQGGAQISLVIKRRGQIAS